MIRETWVEGPKDSPFNNKIIQEVPEIDNFLEEFFALCQKYNMWIYHGYWEDA